MNGNRYWGMYYKNTIYSGYKTDAREIKLQTVKSFKQEKKNYPMDLQGAQQSP